MWTFSMPESVMSSAVTPAATLSADAAKSRRVMVDCQLRTFDVTNRAVLGAMDSVPREAFVDDTDLSSVYSDRALPLPGGRSMLVPMVLGRMIQSLAIEPGQKVLVVGAGTGYGAAVIAAMGAQVVALESDAALAGLAQAALGRLGAAGVEIVQGPHAQGWASGAPYDAILVEGAAEICPDDLLAQLADEGKLIVVMGRGRAGRATLFTRSRDAYGGRPVFDAGAPILPGLEKPPGFVF
jgi:protein-L-isoaspartate(D-aspartate) O-methyltransferase